MAGELIIEDLAQTLDCTGVALVVRDGTTICSKFKDGVGVDTFSIMSATLLGAANTASREIGHNTLERITIKNAEGNVLVYPAGNRNLLVLALDSVPDDIDSKVAEHIARLASL